jgi:hypothetical protein
VCIQQGRAMKDISALVEICLQISAHSMTLLQFLLQSPHFLVTHPCLLRALKLTVHARD